MVRDADRHGRRATPHRGPGRVEDPHAKLADQVAGFKHLDRLELYDQRTVHRGVPNRTTTERPILYLLFARPWFREHINFGETSLFERHVAAAAKKKKHKRRRVPE